MFKGLYTAYTGMYDEQRRLDVLANNLANSNTTGYKKEGLVAQSFDDALAIKIKDTSEPGHLPKTIGTINFGVKVGETYTDWAQGGLQVTDNPYDIALSGRGFFAVEYTNKNGVTSIMYTRDGNFTVDNQGYLRTVDGDYILNATGATSSAYGDGNRVQIDPNATFSVSEDGYISQNGEIVDQIGVIDIANYDYINKYGENLYTLIDGAEIIESEATVQQGCLESSNVNVVDEMVHMIQIARAYEAGQKVIQTNDQTADKAVNQVGRV